MPKRPISPSPHIEACKRLKLTQDQFADASKETAWSNIERVVSETRTNESDSSWIKGNVGIVFHSRKDVKQFKLRSVDGDVLEITISCQQHAQFKVNIGSKVKLSLRGGTLAKSSSPSSLHFSLHFIDGATMEIMKEVKGLSMGVVFDFWNGACFIGLQ